MKSRRVLKIAAVGLAAACCCALVLLDALVPIAAAAARADALVDIAENAPPAEWPDRFAAALHGSGARERWLRLALTLGVAPCIVFGAWELRRSGRVE